VGPSHRRRGPRALKVTPRITWPVILRTFGLVGAAWEIFHEHVDRPYILALLGGCLGLPEFITGKKKDDDG
jgi:hypothetical protein